MLSRQNRFARGDCCRSATILTNELLRVALANSPGVGAVAAQAGIELRLKRILPVRLPGCLGQSPSSREACGDTPCCHPEHQTMRSCGIALASLAASRNVISCFLSFGDITGRKLPEQILRDLSRLPIGRARRCVRPESLRNPPVADCGQGCPESSRRIVDRVDRRCPATTASARFEPPVGLPRSRCRRASRTCAFNEASVPAYRRIKSGNESKVPSVTI